MKKKKLVKVSTTETEFYTASLDFLAAALGRRAKCKNVARYKGTKFPRCNGGKPCLGCLLLWAHAETVNLFKQEN